MKKTIYIALVTIAVFSCKKEKSAPASTHNNLIGKWNLVVFSGGIAGGVYHPNGTATVEFNTDSTYKNYANNLIVDQGTYHIRAMATPVYSPNVKDSVIYYSTRSNTQSYVLKAPDTLLLFDYNISDGYSYNYVRIK